MPRLIFTLILLASAAQADIITQTALVANWQGHWGNSITLPFQQFDPMLGELTRVQFQATADVGMYFPDWPSGSPNSVTIQNTLYTFLGFAYRVFTYSNPGDLTAPVNTSMKVTKAGSLTHNLDSFVGTDFWPMTVFGDSWVYSQTPFSSVLPAGVPSLRNLSVELDYEYTPATVAAAEPRYAGLLIIVIAFGAWVARRRVWGHIQS